MCAYVRVHTYSRLTDGASVAGSCLRQALMVAHTGLADLQASKASPVSTSHLSIGALRLQTYATMSVSIWVVGI